MRWSKRGNGRQYDSLNGYGAFIGYLSKKLDFGTCNRKCQACDLKKAIETHDCRRNFSRTAKAMEVYLGAQLVTEGSVSKDCNLKVKVLIDNEDASTIAAVRRAASWTVFKLADTNHLKNDVNQDLHDLKLTHKELRGNRVIPNISEYFSYQSKSGWGYKIQKTVKLYCKILIIHSTTTIKKTCHLQTFLFHRRPAKLCFSKLNLLVSRGKRKYYS